MARSNQESALAFGFAGLALLRGGIVVGQSEIVGNFSAEVSPEIVKTEGGSSSYAVEARLGRSSGEGAVGLRERPDWIETELAGGTSSNTAAAADPAAGSIVDRVGTSIASAVTAAVASTSNQFMDFEIEATAPAVVRVRIAGSNGAQEFEDITLSSSATEVGQTGVSLSASSPSFATGDRAAFSVTPANGGVSVISVPSVRVANEYEMRFYSAPGGSGDAIFIYTFPRVILRGVNVMLEDVSMNEVEIPIQVLSPRDGSAVYTLRKIYRA